MTIWQRWNRINLNEERFTKPILFALLLVSVVIAIYVTYPTLKDRFVINNDLRTTIYWMPKFQDAELFNDYLSRRMIENSYNLSLGYVLLYHMTSFIMEPILFSKILPFILGPLTILYLFKTGKLISGNVTGIIVALFVIPFLQDNTFAGGLTRAFRWPLFVTFVYYLLSRKFLIAGIILILQALFYAPILLISILAYFLSSFYFMWKGRKIKFGLVFPKQKFLWALGAIFISFLILCPVIFRQLTLHRPMLEMSAFGPRGRHPTFLDRQVSYGSLVGGIIRDIRTLKLPRHYFLGRAGIAGAREKDGDKITPLLLLSFLSIFILKRESFKLDKVIYSVALASAILFIAAWIFFPALYFPRKYNVGLMLFLILFSARGLESSIGVLPFLKTKEIIKIGVLFIIICSLYPSFLFFSKKVLFGTLACGLAFLILVFIFRIIPRGLAYHNSVLLVSIVLISIWLTFFKDLGIVDPTDTQKNLYRYISSLPKTSLIAGHPKDDNLDNIPFYAKRAVFLNTELFGSLTAGGIDKNFEERACGNLDAYYSDSWERVLSFCRKYGVTHLLINKRYFSEVELFYQPISERVKKIIKSREKFILSKLPVNILSFYDNGIGVVNVSTLESYYSNN